MAADAKIRYMMRDNVEQREREREEWHKDKQNQGRSVVGAVEEESRVHVSLPYG